MTVISFGVLLRLQALGACIAVLSAACSGGAELDGETPSLDPTTSVETTATIDASSQRSSPSSSGPGAASSPSPVVTGSDAASSTPTQRPDSSGVMAMVMGVTDGDTFDVRIGGVVEAVRVIGINTPESGECYYQEAADRFSELVLNVEVRLEADVSNRDQFGRLLRYVYVGDLFVNEVLVREGYAIARRYEPDVAMAGQLEAAQAQAQLDRVGVWASSACGPTAVGVLEIGVIHYDADGDDNQNKNDEWVEFINGGNSPLDLTGWSIKDESASHRYLFPSGFTLASGGTVRLHTGCGAPTAAALFWCNQQSAVWNNGGDTVFVLDPSGNIVSSAGY